MKVLMRIQFIDMIFAEQIKLLKDRDHLPALKTNIESALISDIVTLLKLSNIDVSSELLLHAGLDGARILSFSSVGAMLSSIDADPSDCVEYLRLYSFVHHLKTHHDVPSKTAVSLADKDAHATEQLRKHGVTEEMLLYMDPPLMFSQTLGIKPSVLNAIKEAVVEKRRGSLLLLLSSKSFPI